MVCGMNEADKRCCLIYTSHSGSNVGMQSVVLFISLETTFPCDMGDQV
jgi:hypothetical protein